MEKEGRGVERERTRLKGPGTSEPGLNCRGFEIPRDFPLFTTGYIQWKMKGSGGEDLRHDCPLGQARPCSKKKADIFPESELYKQLRYQ
jgi:hypothetical protein